MKSTRLMLGIWVAALLLAAAAPAGAQSTVEECQAQIDLIQSDLDEIADRIGGNNPGQTYTSLSSKLQAASDKLDQGKYADALRKLEDFQDAVISMRDAAKPKLSASDAGLLLDGAAAAIGCIGLLP
jgi:hypothetical protein